MMLRGEADGGRWGEHCERCERCDVPVPVRHPHSPTEQGTQLEFSSFVHASPANKQGTQHSSHVYDDALSNVHSGSEVYNNLGQQSIKGNSITLTGHISLVEARTGRGS